MGVLLLLRVQLLSREGTGGVTAAARMKVDLISTNNNVQQVQTGFKAEKKIFQKKTFSFLFGKKCVVSSWSIIIAPDGFDERGGFESNLSSRAWL